MAQAARPMCLEWDSNPHCTDFEAVSSTSWDTEASFATELSFSVAARFPGRQRRPPIHHNIAISWHRPAASPFARSGARKTFPATAGNREPMANPADGLQTPAARPDTTRKREPMPMEIHRQSDPWRPSPFHEESRATVLDARRFQAEKPVLRPRDLGSFPRLSSTRNTATGSRCCRCSTTAGSSWSSSIAFRRAAGPWRFPPAMRKTAAIRSTPRLMLRRKAGHQADEMTQVFLSSTIRAIRRGTPPSSSPAACARSSA